MNGPGHKCTELVALFNESSFQKLLQAAYGNVDSTLEANLYLCACVCGCVCVCWRRGTLAARMQMWLSLQHELMGASAGAAGRRDVWCQTAVDSMFICFPVPLCPPPPFSPCHLILSLGGLPPTRALDVGTVNLSVRVAAYLFVYFPAFLYTVHVNTLTFIHIGLAHM